MTAQNLAAIKIRSPHRPAQATSITYNKLLHNRRFQYNKKETRNTKSTANITINIWTRYVYKFTLFRLAVDLV